MELRGIEYFKKGTEIRKVNEDPTYLSFFMLFNTGDSNHSPLLHPTGGAVGYFENVIGGEAGAKYAEKVRNFQKLLLKINKEMPWYWQELAGLDQVMTYKNMEDPWWGRDKKIEITCLEENVELMGTTLMKLYRDFSFDFERWIEILPERLRIFEVDIFVSEVRTFQQNITDREKGLGGKISPDSGIEDGTTNLAPGLTIDAKPLLHVQLGHCVWDMDSTKEILSDLSKNPEMKKTKLGFTFSTVKMPTYVSGINLGVSESELVIPERNQSPTNVYDPKSNIPGQTAPENSNATKDRLGATDKGKMNTLEDSTLGSVKDSNGLKDRLGAAAKGKMNKLKDRALGVVAQATNVLDGLTPGALGNAHGALLTGPLANVANQIGENLTGKLFLDNVYGVSTSATVADAIKQGSINGLINAAGQLSTGGGSTSGGGSISPKQVYDTIAPDIDGPISPKKVYDPSAPDLDTPINDNVYE